MTYGSTSVFNWSVVANPSLDPSNFDAMLQGGGLSEPWKETFFLSELAPEAYLPTKRPWYQDQARAFPYASFTPPYIYNGGMPGITANAPFIGPNRSMAGVKALDVGLTEMVCACTCNGRALGRGGTSTGRAG